eukprot:16431928-Heterocapsa_arctica.AAC.2
MTSVVVRPAMYWKSPYITHAGVFLDTCTLKRLALQTQEVLRGWAEIAHASVPPLADKAAQTVVVAAMKSAPRGLAVRVSSCKLRMVIAGPAKVDELASWSSVFVGVGAVAVDRPDSPGIRVGLRADSMRKAPDDFLLDGPHDLVRPGVWRGLAGRPSCSVGVELHLGFPIEGVRHIDEDEWEGEAVSPPQVQPRAGRARSCKSRQRLRSVVIVYSEDRCLLILQPIHMDELQRRDSR